MSLLQIFCVSPYIHRVVTSLPCHRIGDVFTLILENDEKKASRRIFYDHAVAGRVSPCLHPSGNKSSPQTSERSHLPVELFFFFSRLYCTFDAEQRRSEKVPHVTMTKEQ
jgi:hypothetical protein